MDLNWTITFYLHFTWDLRQREVCYSVCYLEIGQLGHANWTIEDIAVNNETNCMEKCGKSDNFQICKSLGRGPFFLFINFELHVKGRGKLRKFKRGCKQKSLGSPALYISFISITAFCKKNFDVRACTRQSPSQYPRLRNTTLDSSSTYKC